jgi:hypothetical protein
MSRICRACGCFGYFLIWAGDDGCGDIVEGGREFLDVKKEVGKFGCVVFTMCINPGEELDGCRIGDGF